MGNTSEYRGREDWAYPGLFFFTIETDRIRLGQGPEAVVNETIITLRWIIILITIAYGFIRLVIWAWPREEE